MDRTNINWKPSLDDDNSYVWREGYWHDDLTWEEEEAAERAWSRNQRRSEWDYYHPGEPCPKSELE